jgi:hypothetical protein
MPNSRPAIPKYFDFSAHKAGLLHFSFCCQIFHRSSCAPLTAVPMFNHCSGVTLHLCLRITSAARCSLRISNRFYTQLLRSLHTEEGVQLINQIRHVHCLVAYLTMLPMSRLYSGWWTVNGHDVLLYPGAEIRPEHPPYISPKRCGCQLGGNIAVQIFSTLLISFTRTFCTFNCVNVTPCSVVNITSVTEKRIVSNFRI